MKIKTSEQSTVKAILEFLAYKRILPIHVRNTGILMKKNGEVRFGRVSQSQKGAPDIVFSHNGWFVAVEVKSSTGKLSDDQIDWGERFQQPPNSGTYILARSVDDVENLLKGMG